MNKKLYIFFYIFISILFVLLLSTTTSPIYRTNPCWCLDSGIFQEVGLLINYGGIPYVDIFDHKGPVLFYIQALGLCISENWGISILQIIFLFTSICIWNSILNLFNLSNLYRCFLLMVGLIFLMGYYDRGNLSEEWSLLFISIPILLLGKGINKESPLPSLCWFAIGFCIGTILFIRTNNIAPILGFLVIQLINEWRTSKKILITNIFFMVLGISIVATSWIIFYYVKSGWIGVDWMIYGTFIYNFQYIQQFNNNDILKSIIFYLSIICTITTLILTPTDRYKSFSYATLVSIMFSTIAIGVNQYTHYLIIFIPLIIVSLGIVSKNKTIAPILILIALGQSIYLGYHSSLELLVAKLCKGIPQSESSCDFHDFLQTIPEEERDSIYNIYALPSFCFAEEKIVHMNKVVMKSHVEQSNKLTEYVASHGIIEKRPCWLLIGDETEFSNNEETLFFEKNYHLKDSVLGPWGNVVYCYHRKYPVQDIPL